ncbi:MAG: hypothetical protein FJ146_11535 [Deltaproteobacteria bacterium]|nr:hypothetical protein [Deltaproteobacteria bacterium]
MKSQHLALVSVTLLAVSCGKITTERERNQAREIDNLRGELASKDLILKSAAADIADSKKSIAERDEAAVTLKADVAKKDAEVSALSHAVAVESAKVAAADARIVDLRRRYTHHDEEVAKLTAALDARSAALATASADNTALAAKEAELRKNLETAKTERESAANDLKKALDERSALEKTLADEKRTALRVFLENAAPDLMFGAAGADVAEIFIKRGDDCAVILDFDPDVIIVRAADRGALPSINGYTILSMRVGYRKVAICRDGNKIEAQVERGSLYRGFGYGSERVLISGRDSSTCDKASSDTRASAILGDSRYVMVNPFRGEMDGIETIDLPANEKVLRLHMGSALVGAPTCAEAARGANGGDLVAVACAVALDKPVDGLSVTKGCFSKKSFLGRESTKFTAE